MRLSQYAKIYQLKHGHKMTAVLTRGEQEQNFRYGHISDKLSKTAYVHGVEGTERLTEIETVNFVDVQVGDKITLANGVTGKAHEVTQTLLNNYAAEKITKITIKHV